MNLYIGNNYNQTCDSVGPHNKADLMDLADGTTHVRWQAAHRENFDGWKQKYDGDYSWDNLYCWNSHPFAPSMAAPTRLVYCVDVMPITLDDVNTFEFEVHAVPFPMEIYNMAWQFVQVKPCRASTFNYGHGWDKAFDLVNPMLSVGKWSSLCAMYEILPKGPHHTGIQFDGVYKPQDIQRPWVQSKSEGDKNPHINFAFQFDSLNKGMVIEALVRTRLVIV